MAKTLHVTLDDIRSGGFARCTMALAVVCLGMAQVGCVGARSGAVSSSYPVGTTHTISLGRGVSSDNIGSAAAPASRLEPANGGEASRGQAAYGPIAGLQTCLFEAKQLAALSDGVYRPQVATLYHHLRVAKYYATIAGQLTTGTASLITPMYQYQIADSCNGISQSLLIELKKGLIPGRGVAHK